VFDPNNDVGQFNIFQGKYGGLGLGIFMDASCFGIGAVEGHMYTHACVIRLGWVFGTL